MKEMLALSSLSGCLSFFFRQLHVE